MAGLIIAIVIVLLILIIILSSIKIVNTGYLYVVEMVWSIPQSFRTWLACYNSIC